MDRSFKDLRAPSGKEDASELACGERFDDSGMSWDELLRSQRILMVSEAGAGKTYECESKARELFARGEPAFFLTLESVASAGVAATLFGDDHTRFTDWLASSSQVAYFFLDSIDELQLVHRSFKDALRRFAHDIREALGRATVVITARPVPIDRQAFRDILPVQAPVRQEDSHDEFIRIAMDGPSNSKDDGPPASREVELLPLTGPQIIEFARSRCVENPEALLAAIDAKHAREFARKPQDLIELCDDSGLERVVDALLKSPDINVNSQDYLGRTALHAAVTGNSTACARMLLEKQPDMTLATFGEGQTALHTAVRMGSLKAVTLIKEEFPFLTGHRNAVGRTPAEQCEESLQDYDTYAKVLTTHGRVPPTHDALLLIHGALTASS